MSVFTTRGIKLLGNLIVIVIILMGVTQVFQKASQLVSAPDEINILKLDVPWVHPGDNVSILLNEEALAENPELYRRLQIGIFIYDLAERVVYILILVIILILLKRLILAIRSKTFFEPGSLKVINQLGFVVAVYVLCKFLFYQVVPVIIPEDLIVEAVNFTTFSESVFQTVMVATDFKMLFVGICLFVISVAFKEGYHFKSESELTI